MDSYTRHCLADDSACVIEGQGKNIIPPPEREPLWRGFLRKFQDPLMVVLLVVFCFSVAVSAYNIAAKGAGWGTLVEPIGILIALLLATGVGFALEVRAEEEFRVLNRRKDERPVRVMRWKHHDHHGERRPRLLQVRKRDVVVGDVVRLESGDEVPADGTLLRAIALHVDESAFTGELYAAKSLPSAAGDVPETAYPRDFLLRGSTVIEGNCLYRVTATGMDTEEGKGARILREETTVRTPLNRQLDRFGTLITRVSYALAVLIVLGRLLCYVSQDGGLKPPTDWMDFATYALNSVMLAVTLIVVAVPEGLPMSVTISLALSMKRMLKENNLVRKLHACETMGAATVICTDKTGTLTQNRLQVVDAQLYADAAEVARSVAVNSTAELEALPDGHTKPLGNPTEGALLQWLATLACPATGALGWDYQTLREQATIVEQETFSTETKRMTTVAADALTGQTLRHLKGAPEIVLNRCQAIGGGQTRAEVEAQLRTWQERGCRTLAIACQRVAPDADGPMTLIAIVCMADPLRADVTDAIATARQAGVRVIMVTGDGMLTANQIARQTGIMTADEPLQEMTGERFAQLTDEEAKARVLPELKVLSRARPADKARLVTLLQAQHHVVAVTGDGTNDAPALKKAQVGLSMGDGTSRAKEASDITILDNSFASINTAILWGRSLYLNIQRFILFQMTINVSACLIVLFGAFIGLDSPLNVTQMLWVNLIMDTFAALALSSLPPDPRVMHDAPRSPRASIIDRRMALQILGVGLVFFAVLFGLWQLLWHSTIHSVSDLTAPGTLGTLVTGLFDLSKRTNHLTPYELGFYFTFFVLLQFWNLLNARYFRTGRTLLQDLGDCLRHPSHWRRHFSSGFFFIMGLILGGQILIVSCFGQLFGVAPLSLSDWGWLLLCTCPVLLIGEVLRSMCLLHKTPPVD